jgi:protein kinase-like protein
VRRGDVPLEHSVFEPGTQLGRYEIQRRLGRGGMGTIYVAHDPVLGRMVAIKVFAGDLDVPDARERFSREARAAAALNHPNIVTVYDFGEYGSQPYIVMEYVPGETMANLIRRKVPVSIADKLRWMQELCAGAGYAHQMSVIHRDIKPANLMIDRTGRLKILDFGIARMLGIASNTSVMIGTPGYMAPEQITGDPIDHRSDQFSIGVVFYELLAYTEAFPGDTLPAITHKILTEQPKPLQGLAQDATPEVIAIVEQAMKKNIAERFRDTETMRTAISRVRRQFNTDESWSGVPTLPVGRDTPVGGINRGTGSARQRTGNVIGVAQLTPPPDPRRTDREALARRRAAQVEAALAHARQLVAAQQLDAALDACQQALTLDENHAGALELEQEIETALGLRDRVAISADDPDITVATDPSALDSRLMESQAVTRMHEEGYAVAGLPGTQPALAGASPTGAGERSVLPAQNPPAQNVPSQRVPVRKGPGGPDLLTRLKTAVAPVVASLQSIPATLPNAETRTIVAIAAGVIVVAIAATAYFLTRGPVPTGTLVVEAAPWATVTAIRAENGREQMVPADASTPLSIAVPEGTYQITLAGPGSKTATVTAHVTVGGIAVAPMARFDSGTVEDYFEQFLAGSAAPTEPAPPAAGGNQ